MGREIKPSSTRCCESWGAAGREEGYELDRSEEGVEENQGVGSTRCEQPTQNQIQTNTLEDTEDQRHQNGVGGKENQ